MNSLSSSPNTILMNPPMEFVTCNEHMSDILEEARSFAQYDESVLITGETGVGKSLLARDIHNISPRKNSPFVTVDCSAFNKNLIELTLFGHEKGSFTGAHEQKKGVFEQADTGTIFLDEIGELPLPMQAKLLQVTDNKSFRRIAGSEEIKCDIRIIAATNKSVKQMVGNGSFSYLRNRYPSSTNEARRHYATLNNRSRASYATTQLSKRELRSKSRRNVSATSMARQFQGATQGCDKSLYQSDR